MTQPLILLTNDDGLASPGLAAAAAALAPLGELLIVAPAFQQSSMGRSRTQQGGLDGRLHPGEVRYGDQVWPGVAAYATPALAVEHALLELATRPVDLVVSGINYGENVSTCVTVSGTLGAGFEAAERGVPALAVSLETTAMQYYDHDPTVDFTGAAHFVQVFARRILAGLDHKATDGARRGLPLDVDVLKVDVPWGATEATPWQITKQDRMSYYTPLRPDRDNPFVGPGPLVMHVAKGCYSAEGTDAWALSQGIVSVTPLSLDLTSRIRAGAVLDFLGGW
jgi:5'-nucleotidase